MAVREEWTIHGVEDALIECHGLWWRSPGAGSWPFAGDGPWHLIRGEVGDYAGDTSESIMQTEAGKDVSIRVTESRAPRVPLNVAEVETRDRVTAWLALLADPVDRQIVHHATFTLWRGEGRIGWRAIAGWIRWTKSDRAMSWRYRKALGTITCVLNGWPSRRAKALADGYTAPERD